MKWEREPEKKKNRPWRTPLTYLSVWFLIMIPVCAYFWFKLHQKENALEERLNFIQNNEEGLERAKSRYINKKQKEQIKKDLPAIAEVLNQFLKTRETSARYSLVFDPSNQAAPMRAYYQNHLAIDEGKTGKWTLVKWEVAERMGRSVVASLLDQGNAKMAVVFVNTDVGWVIDWRFLERYSDQSWVTFFSDLSKEKEAKMRCYVRKKSVQKENEWEISIHEPQEKIGQFNQDPVASFTIDRESLVGRQLTYVFDGEGAIGGESLYKKMDPSNAFRALVQFKRTVGGDGIVKLELDEIIASNWLDENLQDVIKIPGQLDEADRVGAEKKEGEAPD